jgi:hypothetical protein
MRVADAAKWYRASVPLIATVLEQRPAHLEPFVFAWNLKSRLRLAGALALWDQELVNEWLASFPLPTIDEFAERSAERHPQREIDPDIALEMLLVVSEQEKRAFPGTVGESIGLEVWDGKQNWIMTEQGWQPKAD